MIKVEYYFKGIDCPNCASKVENYLNKQDCFEEVVVNFLSKKIIIKFREKEIKIEELTKIIKKLEPDVELSLEEFDHLKEHHSCDNHHEEHHSCDHHHEEHHCCCHHDEEHHSCGHHHEEHHCCCHHDEEHHCCCNNKKKNCKIILFGIGIILSILGLLFGIIFNETSLAFLSKISYVIAYVLLANKIIIKSIKNIIKGNIFDENFLMLIASIGALIINEGLEAILVVLLYTIGEYFQDKALGDSTKEIASLTKLKVDKTHLENGEDVLTKDVKCDDIIIVKVGERVPLDGEVVKGSSSIDTKVITGESMPQDVTLGSKVLSGCINLKSVLYLKVINELKNTTTSKIIEMVELASNKKSKTEEFITKFAKVYTPIILICAVVVFLVEWLLIDYFSLYDALNNCFVFLVSSCPCALVISIPLAFFGGIGRCSSYGVLVKGGNYIEALSKTKTICFDKTGTLTKGNFIVTKINPINITEEEFLNYLVSIELLSNHPIAKSISNISIKSKLTINNVTELAGYGIKGYYNNSLILAGNYELMVSNKIEVNKQDSNGSIVYLAIDNNYYGYVIIEDEIKNESYKLIESLNELSIKTVLITGDNEITAKAVGSKLGIKEVYYKLLPDEKLEILSNIITNKNNGDSIVYVGDGINDTPSLKLADIGVAVNNFGNDEAIEASDVVLLSDNMYNLVKAIKISKYTKKVLLQNIIFALSVKFIALIIGMLGILGSYGMLLGVFADVGVCLITILNTLKILKFGGKNE